MARIITFFGGDSKVGTSMVCQSAAELLIKENKKVLLIFASCEYGDDYVPEKYTGCLDDIKRNENIEIEDVKKITTIKGDLHYICGVKNTLEVKTFPTSLLAEIIEAVKAEYNYILIDGGYNLQYPLPVASLVVADMVYYVLTPNEKTIRRFTNTSDMILKTIVTEDKDQSIICSKTSKKFSTYSKDQISKMFNLQVYDMPFISDSEGYELERRTMLDVNSYQKTLQPLVLDIISKEIKAEEGEDEDADKRVSTKRLFKFKKQKDK